MTQPLPFDFPSIVTVSPPMIPQLVLAPPIAGNTVTVLPVVGPKGDTGGTGEMGYGPVSVTNQTAVQIRHGLTFDPAGIVCLQTDGVQVEYDTITYPSSGTTEITFGTPFTGAIRLS